MMTIRKVAFCPHCGHPSPQQHIHTQNYQDYKYSRGGNFSNKNIPCACYVAACETCNKILLYLAYNDIKEDNHFHLAKLIWPEPGVLDKSVPITITKLYTTATRLKKDPDAFAVRIRQALEEICKDRGVKKEGLWQSLKELASQGDIPPLLVEMTEVIRLLGNVGAHTIGVKQKHVPVIDQFFRWIISYVYIAPSMIKEFHKKHKGILGKENSSGDA